MSEIIHSDDFINSLIDPVNNENKKMPENNIKTPCKKNITTPKYRIKDRKRILACGGAILTITTLAVGLISTKIYGSTIDVEKTASQIAPTENSMGYLESMLENEYEQGIVRTYEEEKDAPFKDVCINIPDDATKYLSEVNYNKVINRYGDAIKNYSKEFGVDPNVIAAIIMVENPDYDKDAKEHYYQIGLGQYNGDYFLNQTFTAYNFVDGKKTSYEVTKDNLYNNPDAQIKLLCMLVANSAKEYNYNIVAILENHNKGCGSVNNCLDLLKNERGYNNRREVLDYEDENEIIKNINKIGDPLYSYKVSYYIKMGLDKKTFNKNDYLSFKDENTFDEKHIDFKTSTMQRI